MYSRRPERQKSQQTEAQTVRQLPRGSRRQGVRSVLSAVSVLNGDRTDVQIPEAQGPSAGNALRRDVIIVSREETATEIVTTASREGTATETEIATIASREETATEIVTTASREGTATETEIATIVSREGTATEIATAITASREGIVTETGTAITVSREEIVTEIVTEIEIEDRDADPEKEATAAEAKKEAAIPVSRLLLWKGRSLSAAREKVRKTIRRRNTAVRRRKTGILRARKRMTQSSSSRSLSSVSRRWRKKLSLS
jgi:hypothetical protein